MIPKTIAHVPVMTPVKYRTAMISSKDHSDNSI